MAEMAEHVENLQRVRLKLEKDKQIMKAEIDDLNVTIESVQKSKVTSTDKKQNAPRLAASLSEFSADLSYPSSACS